METMNYPGRFESLPEIGVFISKAAKNAGLSDKAAYAVQLAVDEACSNIIDHAYGGEDIGEIECTVIENDGLTVILRDFGRPFNPKEIPEPNRNIPLHKLKPRGVGLYLIRKMVDEMHYLHTSEQGNVLTLKKRK
jgi:serine/threonine-protein kinase RsbW